ncbi:citrate lyase holo-[acyl-carrier protein] synthase [Desulfovibrio desulfuricans]|nr:citrate lyase holo-[acyl-carrier protein] synthase [Desulfovibrio desulfuricans]
MDLCQLLAERERRWNKRLSLAGMYNCPVLSLTLNIPGPSKNLPGADAALSQLRTALCCAVDKAGGSLVDECRLSGPDGPGWVAAVRMDALDLKRAAVAVEESHVLGRLADADVMDAQGQPVNRAHLAAGDGTREILPGKERPDSPDSPDSQGRGSDQAAYAPRRCFLCSQPASLCRREQRHSLEDLLAAVRGLLRLAERASEQSAKQGRACRP